MIHDTFPDPDYDPPREGAQTLFLAGGCFWCTEGVFREVPGVLDVVSGYAGGEASTANYKAVCEGDTGHAEVVAIVYHPDDISMGQLLKIFFWLAHDPTQRNRQGNDIGTQYRSAVFYTDDIQKDVVERYIALLNAAHVFDNPIVTTLEPLAGFYRAEDYHQDYAASHEDEPYIRGVAQPKIDKTRKHFED